MVGACLLKPEKSRLLVVHHVDGGLLAVLPAVVAVGIGGGTHADVVRDDLYWGRLLCPAAREERCGANDKRKDFLHGIFMGFWVFPVSLGVRDGSVPACARPLSVSVADEGQKLLARAGILEEDARKGRCGRCRALLLDAAHLHAHVAGLYDDGHAYGVEGALYAVAYLYCEAFLYLKATGVALDHAGDLREACDVAVGDIRHVRLAHERHEVVFAERE